MSQSEFILGFFVRLLHHPELHERLQGAVWTLPSAQYPGHGYCSPCSNQNGTAWGCVCKGSSALQPQSPGVLQPSLAAAKSQDLPLTASESGRYMSLVPILASTHKGLKEEHAGELAVTQSWDKKHTHKRVHVPEEARHSSTSLFLPQNYLSPSFASTKTEIKIFRELIFRMIRFQKGGMKGFLQNIFLLFYLFREGCVLRHKTQRVSAETSDRHTPTLLRYPLLSISHH